MLVSVVPRAELTPVEAVEITERVEAPEHAYDSVGPDAWRSETIRDATFVAFREVGCGREPFGILTFCGLLHQTEVSWWIDRRHRGQGLGRLMVDVMANDLERRGATGIGDIKVITSGEYTAQSGTLVRRLKAHFPPAP